MPVHLMSSMAARRGGLGVRPRPEAALALLVVAQALLPFEVTRLAGVAVALPGLWLAARTLAPPGRDAAAAGAADIAAPAPLSRRTALLLLVLILLLAAGFRLWRLSSSPPGLYVDEVLVAENALAWRGAEPRPWLGSTPLLVEGWVESSNLYLALASGLLWLFGDGLEAIRMLSALPSLAAVPLLYLLGAAIASRTVGLAAAFLLACSHWAVRTGRTGWDEVLMTALQLGALLCLVHLVRRPRSPRAPLLALGAGLLLGAALHTYVAAQLVVLQAGLWLGWEAWRSGAGSGPGIGRGDRRRLLAAGALCLGTAALAALPYYLPLALDRPEVLGVRQRELSLANHPAGAWVGLGESLAAHALMFNGRGGTYARDDLPGFPLLDPLTGVLFLAGLAVVASRRCRFRALLVSWGLVCLAGGVLSISGEGPPYPFRVANLAPWACLVAALGGVGLWRALAAGGRRPRILAPAAAAALAAVVAANAWVYFVRGPAYPGTAAVYATVETRLGRWLAEHQEGRPCLVSDEVYKTVRAQLGDIPYRRINRQNHLRRDQSITAVRLAAGALHGEPRRTLDPAAPDAGIERVRRLPERLSEPTLLAVTRARVPEVRRAFRIRQRWDLHDPLGRYLCTVLEAAPRRAGQPPGDAVSRRRAQR